MNVFLVYFDLKLFNVVEGAEIGDIIANRIVGIGERYHLGTNLYLVKSDRTAMEIHASIAQPYMLHGDDNPREFNNIGLVVTRIDTENANTFGVWSAELWRFLGLFDDAKLENDGEPENNDIAP